MQSMDRLPEGFNKVISPDVTEMVNKIIELHPPQPWENSEHSPFWHFRNMHRRMSMAVIIVQAQAIAYSKSILLLSDLTTDIPKHLRAEAMGLMVELGLAKESEYNGKQAWRV